MSTPPDVSAFVALIVSCLRELDAGWGHGCWDAAGADTKLWAAGSPLDSVGLVQLVAEVEARAAEEFGVEIVLADEAALSRRRSPFATVGTLAAWAAERAGGEGGA